MDRIMITGFSGCGKSTLARRLGDILGIEPTHMDALHWLPGWKESTPERKIRLLRPVIERPRWIIEGNYHGTLWKERIERADTIIFLDYNRFLCLWHVIKRRIVYSGKTRPDMGEGCKEKLDLEFIKWVLIDGRRKRKKMLAELSELEKSKDIYIFRSMRETEKFVKEIERKERK